MTCVNIAELKSHLSAYVKRARAGEEILIRDRNLPVAKLVPASVGDEDARELALAAAGKLKLPTEPFDEKAFWAIGKNLRWSRRLAKAARTAVTLDRQERDDSLLGL